MASKHNFELRERITYDDRAKMFGEFEEEKHSLNPSNTELNNLLSREMPLTKDPFGLSKIFDKDSDSESELGRDNSDEQQRTLLARHLRSTESRKGRPSAVSRTSRSFVVFQRTDDQIGVSEGLLSQSMLQTAFVFE